MNFFSLTVHFYLGNESFFFLPYWTENYTWPKSIVTFSKPSHFPLFHLKFTWYRHTLFFFSPCKNGHWTIVLTFSLNKKECPNLPTGYINCWCCSILDGKLLKIWAGLHEIHYIILPVWEVFKENAIVNPRFDSKTYLENDELWLVVGAAGWLHDLWIEIQNIFTYISFPVICEWLLAPEYQNLLFYKIKCKRKMQTTTYEWKLSMRSQCSISLVLMWNLIAIDVEILQNIQSFCLFHKKYIIEWVPYIKFQPYFFWFNKAELWTVVSIGRHSL